MVNVARTVYVSGYRSKQHLQSNKIVKTLIVKQLKLAGFCLAGAVLRPHQATYFDPFMNRPLGQSDG